MVTAGPKSSTINLNDADSKVIVMKINNKSYSINGENQKMDAAPFIKNDRTMVPIRFIISAFGGEISWDENTRTAIVKYNNDEIEIPIDSNTVKVNGENQNVDSPAIIKDNRTFVPIRFVAENFGMNIEYNEKTKEVTITENNKKIYNNDTNAEKVLDENNNLNNNSNNINNQQ